MYQCIQRISYPKDAALLILWRGGENGDDYSIYHILSTAADDVPEELLRGGMFVYIEMSIPRMVQPLSARLREGCSYQIIRISALRELCNYS